MHALLPALVVAGCAIPASADDVAPIDLDLLFIGNADSERTRDFAAFLEAHFASVRVADRAAFDPATVGDVDVALLDWSQRDIDFRAPMSELESPLGPREAWTTPTVLLGSAGLLIAAPWQTNGSYG
jgi:hypothetical protein